MDIFFQIHIILFFIDCKGYYKIDDENKEKLIMILIFISDYFMLNSEINEKLNCEELDILIQSMNKILNNNKNQLIFFNHFKLNLLWIFKNFNSDKNFSSKDYLAKLLKVTINLN